MNGRGSLVRYYFIKQTAHADVVGGFCFTVSDSLSRLVLELRNDELAVEASDVSDAFVLGANSFASTRVGAVTEAEFVHLRYHHLRTLSTFYATLGKESELRHLRSHEEHCRTILAGCHASTTTDARSAVHRFVSIRLRNEDSVSILSIKIV